jgi:O-antigen/teichoic acid export membrane protein
MARIGNTLSQESEPLLITLFLTPEVTAVYMITRKVADIVFQMVSVLYGASYSSFSHLAGEGDKEKTRDMVFKLVVLVFTLSLIGFAVYVGANQSFVELWVGNDFILPQQVVLLIGTAFFFRSVRGIVWQALNGLGNFVHTSIVLVVEGICKVFLAVILLPSLGVVAIPIALTVACLLSLITLGVMLKKVLDVNFNLGSKIRIILSIVSLIGGSSFIASHLLYEVSWGTLILYVSGLISGLALLFGLINYRMCLMMFKRGVE